MRFLPDSALIVFACGIAAAHVDAAPPRADATPRVASHVFRARDVLPASILRGPDYAIDDAVPVIDDRYVFTLRTSDGAVIADGLPMLQVRVDEMRSLEKGRELDKKPQELEGVKDAFKSTGSGLKSLVTDPGDALGNIPKAIGRKFKSLDKKETYRGGSDTRRKFAASLACDPETDHPPLKKILDKLALRRSIGSGVVNVAGFFATAGVATVVRGASALRTTGEMNEVVRTTQLYKINQNIRDELGAMGVPRDLRERFIGHEPFTTVQRMLFMEQFRRIERVPGRERLVERALATHSRAEALQVIRLVELVATLHKARPIRSVTSALPLICDAGGGMWIWFSPADYLTTSESFTRDAGVLLRAAPKDPVLLTDGKIDPAAAQELTRLQVRAIEKGRVGELAVGPAPN